MGSTVGKSVKGGNVGKAKASGKVVKLATPSRTPRAGIRPVNYNVDDALKSALAHVAPERKVGPRRLRSACFSPMRGDDPEKMRVLQVLCVNFSRIS